MVVDDPHERRDVETVFTTNSFDLICDTRDWEVFTLVP
jgi:hypothetical protein